MKVEKTLFLQFITETIKTEGWQVADKANKLALAGENISLDTYSAAAKIIAKEIINR